MSKMGQAVFEGQEFAQENYNEPRDQFMKMVRAKFADRPVQRDAAVEEFDTIGNDLSDYAAYAAEEAYYGN
jgi:hypothetical protein